MLEDAVQAIGEEHFVVEARERVRQGRRRDVRLRAGQALRPPLRVADRGTAGVDPAVAPVFVEHAVRVLESRGPAVHVMTQGLPKALPVALVDAFEPRAPRRFHLALPEPEDAFPPGRKVDATADQVPVPHPVVGALDRQGEPLLALLQGSRRLAVRELALHPRKHHRQVQRLGDVVVRAELQRLHDVGRAVAGRRHEHR